MADARPLTGPIPVSLAGLCLAVIAGGSFYGGFARQLEVRRQPHRPPGHVVVITPTPQVLQWQQNALASPEPARVAAVTASRGHHRHSEDAPSPPTPDAAAPLVQTVADQPRAPAAAEDVAVPASDPQPAAPADAPADEG